MSTIVRDMLRNRILIPALEKDPVDATCAQCGSAVKVLQEHLDSVPAGHGVHVLCVTCIPDYLKG